MQCVAVRCSVLRCVAVWCGVVRCAVIDCTLRIMHCGTPPGRLQCVAVCCSVLQCVAVRCNALQCVAVCCSGLQQFVRCDTSPDALCASMCHICQVDVQTCVNDCVN